MTARAVMKRTKALLRYRRALNDMNKIPDATEEDLARENTCIICREEMRAWDPANNPDAVERTRPKKLRCGHILHLGCLKSWLERQQVCPTCRRSVVVRERGQGGGRQGRDAIQLRLGLGAAAPQQGVAGQQPAVDANAAGPAGQQPGDENLGDNNAVRMQFFNLGPFRVGIGQAVLGLGQGLGQANNQAAPPADAPAQNGAAVPPAVNNNAAARARPGHAQAPSPSADQGQEAPSSGTQPPAQQGPATARLPRFVASRSSRTGTGRGAPGRPDSAAHIRDDLDDVLNRIRAEMDELTRLWGQGSALRYIASLLALYRQGQFANAAFRPPNSFRGAVDLPGFYPADPAVRHTLRPGPAIAAGSPELPEGVVLPEGWSLMPLRRVDQATPRIPSPAGPRMPTPSAGTAAGPTTGGAAPSQPATAEGGSGGPATDNSAGRPSSARVRRPAETIAAMNPSLSAGEFLDRYLDEMLPYSGESGPFSLSGVGHNPRGRATDPAFPFLRNSPTNGELALALLSEVELGQMVAVGDMPVAVATPAVYVPSIAARWRERLTDRDRAVIMEQNMTAANSLVDRLGHRLVLRLLQNHLHNAGHMLRAGPSGIVWDYVHWQAAQLSNPPAQPATSVQSTGPLPSARVPPTASEQAPAAAQAQNVDPSLEAMAQALQRALAAAGGPVVEEMLRGTLPAGLSALFGANGHVPHATQSQNSQPTSVPSQTPSGTADVSRDATSAGADIEPHRPETGRSVDANAATAPNSSNMPRWPGNSQIFTFSVPGTASGQGGSDGNGNSSGSGNGEAGPNFTSSTTETASSDSDEPSTRQKDTGKGKEPAHAAPMEDERKGKEPAHAATVEDAVEDLD